MPQGPIAVERANLVPQGGKTVKNITTATVIKTTPGTFIGYSVTGSALTIAGGIYDSAVTSGNTAANLIIPIPTTATLPIVAAMSIPCNTGILVVPPTGTTVVMTLWYI